MNLKIPMEHRDYQGFIHTRKWDICFCKDVFMAVLNLTSLPRRCTVRISNKPFRRAAQVKAIKLGSTAIRVKAGRYSTWLSSTTAVAFGDYVARGRFQKFYVGIVKEKAKK